MWLRTAAGASPPPNRAKNPVKSKTLAATVDELLSRSGKSIDVFMAEALAIELDYVERVDRLTTIAEGRRNASLREIDRHRPVFAETLRRSVQQIEHDEINVIEAPPSKGEPAA
jgi:hypothetical protein